MNDHSWAVRLKPAPNTAGEKAEALASHNISRKTPSQNQSSTSSVVASKEDNYLGILAKP